MRALETMKGMGGVEPLPYENDEKKKRGRGHPDRSGLVYYQVDLPCHGKFTNSFFFR